jgi:hypothetical protein
MDDDEFAELYGAAAAGEEQPSSALKPPQSVGNGACRRGTGRPL